MSVVFLFPVRQLTYSEVSDDVVLCEKFVEVIVQDAFSSAIMNAICDLPEQLIRGIGEIFDHHLLVSRSHAGVHERAEPRLLLEELVAIAEMKKSFIVAIGDGFAHVR